MVKPLFQSQALELFFTQCAVHPPSTAMECPVTKEAASEQSQTTTVCCTTSATATLAPSLTKANAAVRPMPELPPVTSITLFSNTIEQNPFYQSQKQNLIH
jgi:hypothetical protein